MARAQTPRMLELRAEQIRLLYDHIKPALFTHLAVAPFTVYALWDVTSRLSLLVWLGALLLVTAARAELTRRYYAARPSAAESGRWGKWYLNGVSVTGAIWGASAQLFLPPPDRPVEVLFLTLVLAGLTSGAVASMSASRVAYTMFAVPVLAPMALTLLAGTTRPEHTMGLLVVVYGVALSWVSWRSYAAIRDSILLRHDNRRLVADLSAQIDQRTRAEAALRSAQGELEQRMRDRTRELTAAHEALREAQKMKAVGRLAGGVAHDFNNVLTAIIGWSDLLLTADDAVDDRVRHTIEEVRAAGVRAAGLVRRLLAFSRQQVLAPRPLDLVENLTRMRDLLQRLVGEDVTLALATPASGLTVRVDPAQLEQVVINLVMNARDAIGGVGRIDITLDGCELDAEEAPETGLAGAYARLAVADTGCGMSTEILAQLFEPFFTTKAPGQGTGLGLATVYGVVRQSGGFIRVASEVDRGSTFTIYLPVMTAPVVAAASSTATRPPEARGSETILIVEDEDMVRSVASRALERAGFHVIAAAGGAEAIAVCRARKGDIDLLVTDIVMPGMSGPQVAELLIGEHPGLRVLYTSGYTSHPTLRSALSLTTATFLQKPFTPESLVGKVRAVLDGTEPPIEIHAAFSRTS